MKKVFPAGVRRGYLLDVEVHSSADDEEFYLCFGQGDMFVLIFYSPNNGYSKGYWSSPIPPADFGEHAVDGVSLAQLVRDKLVQILPPGAETDH